MSEIEAVVCLKMEGKILDPSNPAHRPQLVRTLANVAGPLCRDRQAAYVVDLIERLEPQEQVDVLSGHGAVYMLAHSGYAKWTMNLIEKFGPEQQARILAMPHAVRGLAENGEAVRTADRIESLEPERQRPILTEGIARDVFYRKYRALAAGSRGSRPVLALS